MSLTPEAFSVYWIFKKEGIPNLEDRVRTVEEALQRYPHWKTSEHHERAVRRELYRSLLGQKDRTTSDMARIAQQTMRVLRA